MAYSFTPDQLNALKQRATRLFGYQQQWMRNPARQRHYTKMRQCGADFAFSLEALIDAIETGRNQVFIGTTEAYAEGSSRCYIVGFAREVGVRIKSDTGKIVLSNGAEICFAGEKSLFAGLCGNAYVSEYAWATHPRTLFTLGKAVAANIRHRLTTYTTPSKNREAWKVWKNLSPASRGTVILSDHMREDAALFSPEDIDEYRRTMSAENFAMLFMGKWPQEDQEQPE